MSINWDSVGKRVKSSENETVFRGSPGSDDRYTLPAGKPSGLITSYIQRESENGLVTYFQVDETDYIKKTDLTKIVDSDSSDDSGFVSGAFLGVSDLFSGAATSISKNAGFIKEGFIQTTDRSLFEMFDYAGYGKLLRLAVFAVVFFVGLYVLTQIKSLLK